MQIWGWCLGRFDEVFNEFFEDVICVPGAWFHVDDAYLRFASGNNAGARFSAKDKPRPCLLATKPGPNVRVFARTTSRRSRVSHSAHAHEGTCRLTKSGWICEAPLTITRNQLSRENYSCFETDDTLLKRLHAFGGVR